MHLNYTANLNEILYVRDMCNINKTSQHYVVNTEIEKEIFICNIWCISV